MSSEYLYKVGTPHIPDKDLIQKYLEKSINAKHITNYGPNEQLLTEKLKEYFDNEYLLLVNNATNGLIIAMQSIFQSLNARIATTPYSFAATVNAIYYAGYKPKFRDIDDTMEPDYAKFDTSEIDGILGVNIYGNPTSAINNCTGRPLVIDNAHGFDVTLEGRNLANYGDISVLSCHATKLYHTVEGGIIVANKQDYFEEIVDRSNFGLKRVNDNSVGLNAKLSDFHAAVGLANFAELSVIIEARSEMKELWNQVFDDNKSGLFSVVDTPSVSYYPVRFRDHKCARIFMNALSQKKVLSRLYFDRSLCSGLEAADQLAGTIVCIPLLSQYTKSDLVYLKHAIQAGVDTVNSFD